MPTKTPDLWSDPPSAPVVGNPVQITAEDFVKALNDYYSGSLMSVEEIPAIRMREWQVFRVDGADHVIGWNQMFIEGRVSSAIVEFSLNARIARTQSGRIYFLEGPSGYCREAHEVFSKWQVIWKPTQIVEVTNDYGLRQRAVEA